MGRLGECFSDVDFKKPVMRCKVIPYYPGDAAILAAEGARRSAGASIKKELAPVRVRLNWRGPKARLISVTQGTRKRQRRSAFYALAGIGRKVDFLVYVHGHGPGTRSLSKMLAEYRARHQPERLASCRLQGFTE